MIKSRLTNKALRLLVILSSMPVVCLGAHTAPPLPTFQLQYDGRIACHIHSPSDLSSHRHTALLKQKIEYDAFQFKGELKASAEGAYSQNLRYRGTDVAETATDLELRDFYGQWSKGATTFRLGNQIINWSSALSPYYSDVVNPKDLRELGLGEISTLRIPLPMLSVKTILSPFSIQGIWIFRPALNRYPRPGSDFSPNYSALTGTPVSVVPLEKLALDWEHQEFGVRGSGSFDSLDVSLYYLRAFDRSPSHLLRPGSSGLELLASENKTHYLGTTLTHDWGALVSRAEVIYQIDRMPDLLSAGSLNQVKSDQLTWLLGVDLTQFSNFRASLEYADSRLIENITPAFEARHRQWLSLFTQVGFYHEAVLETLLSYIPVDGSTLAQLRINMPISGEIEAILGADYLAGGSNSTYGSFQDGSRIYAGIRAYLGEH